MEDAFASGFPGNRYCDVAESRSRASQIDWLERPAATDTNWTRIIFWARDSHHHVISLSVTDSVHEIFDPNFSENKLLSYGKSSISTLVYDGIKFYRLQWTTNTTRSYVSITLKALHNGKIFKINYFYDDAATKNEIEAMLETSMFDK